MGCPGLRHSDADLITAPITVGIVNREYLRRVQGLVYVAYKMEEPAIPPAGRTGARH